MVRFLACGLVGGLFLCAVATPEARAEKRKVLIVQTWQGSVDDEKLMKDAPVALNSAKGLEKVWKAWKIEGKTPKVDFTKFIVVGVYSQGSKLNLASAVLDDDGNLEVVGLGTRDLRPGFRYVLGMVSNDGVKSVNSKKLPKE